MKHGKVISILAAVIALTLSNSVRAAGEDADYRRAHHLYTLLEYKLAVESLTKYLTDHPKSERAEQARLLLAESYYQLKEYAQASQQFAKFLGDYPSSSRRS